MSLAQKIGNEFAQGFVHGQMSAMSAITEAEAKKAEAAKHETEVRRTLDAVKASNLSDSEKELVVEMYSAYAEESLGIDLSMPTIKSATDIVKRARKARKQRGN
jgi:hypothetical protein